MSRSGESAGFIEVASQVLQDAGYIVEAPGMIKGESGVTHEVDMYCYKEGERVLIDVRSEGDAVGALPILSLFVKVFDFKPSRGILLAIPKACTLAKQLSRLYQIEIGEVESPSKAKVFLKRVIGLEQPRRPPAIDASRFTVVQARKIRVRSVKSALDLLILLSLGDSGLTGYDAIGSIHSRFSILLSPGTVYPVLKKMEREGIIVAKNAGRRRVYFKTHLGNLVSNALYSEYENVQKEILNHLGTLKRASFSTV